MPTPAELRAMKEDTTAFDKRSKTPPANDICPICFDDFAVPCETNCGHWFCGRCMLQLWSYAAAGKQCNCPMCSTLITKLSPDASLLARQDGECVLVLKEVQRYNSLYAGGWKSFFLKILALPFFVSQLFQQWRNLNRVQQSAMVRLIATLLETVLMLLFICGFISEDVIRTINLLNFWGNILALVILLFLVCRICVRKIKARRLAARRLHQD